jgi:hypothetical protein
MEDAKKEPYKTKGYTENTKKQKPNQALKIKIKINSCHCKNMLTMAGLTIIGMQYWWWT